MKRYFFYVILIILTSCYKDFNFKNDFSNKKVNVSCFLKENDTVRLNLSYTTNYFSGSSEVDYIKNASVFLYEENVFKEKLIYNKSGWYYSKTFFPKINRKYELKISVPGFDTIYSETTIPSIIKIDSIKRTLIYSDKYGNCDFKINFYIKDNIKQHNFFYVDVKGMLYSVCSSDIVIEPKENNDVYYWESRKYLKAYFSDSLFSGQSYSFGLISSCHFHRSVVDTIVAYISLNSINQETYLFYKSVYLQFKTLQNPFSEPVVVYSNIKNGTGIFAGIAADVDSIMLINPQLK